MKGTENPDEVHWLYDILEHVGAQGDAGYRFHRTMYDDIQSAVDWLPEAKPTADDVQTLMTLAVQQQMMLLRRDRMASYYKVWSLGTDWINEYDKRWETEMRSCTRADAKDAGVSNLGSYPERTRRGVTYLDQYNDLNARLQSDMVDKHISEILFGG